MVLHAGDRVGEGAGRGAVAHAPAGHAVGLGDAVDGDGVVAEGGIEGGDGVMFALVEEFFVYLVADDPDFPLDAEGGEGVEFVAGVNRAGGVGGAVDYDGLGAGGEGRLEGGGGEVEVLVLGGGDDEGAGTTTSSPSLQRAMRALNMACLAPQETTISSGA